MLRLINLLFVMYLTNPEFDYLLEFLVALRVLWQRERMSITGN